MTAYPLESDIQNKIERAAAYIVETSARDTTSGNWITYAEDLPAEIISPDEYIRHYDAIVKTLHEYEAVADIETTPDGTVDIVMYLAYCPNYEPHGDELDEYPDGREILDALKSRAIHENAKDAPVSKTPTLAERLEEGRRRAAQHEKPINNHKISKQGEIE
jgi:hypothetical protein